MCVLNYEDPILRKFGETLPCRTVWFSSSRAPGAGDFSGGRRNHPSRWREADSGGQDKGAEAAGTAQLRKCHDGGSYGYYAGVPVEKIRETACGFSGVEHRIEYVTEKNGVRYYNDSKGTNPDAAIKGIRAMVRPTLLIGGGYDKQSTYGEWIDSFDGKVKYLVLIGATRDKIAAEALEHGFPRERILFCENLEEAVKTCAAHGEPGTRCFCRRPVPAGISLKATSREASFLKSM